MTSWKSVPLADVAVVSSGDGAPQETSAFGQSGIPFVRAGSLGSLLNGLREDQLERIPENESAKRRMRIFPPETVLFAKSGMSCTKGLVYQSQGRIHVVNHLAAIECGPELFSRFLVRWLERHSPARLIANFSYPSIKVSDIRAERVPLPLLEDQKRIAGILDTADALRAKRRESLAQLDSLLQSTYLDMFGRAGEMVTIGSLLESGVLKVHKDGNHGSLYPRAEEFGVTGVPFLSARCISAEGTLLPSEVQFLQEGKARTLKLGWIEEGDVLLAHNASVGKTCLYRGEYDEALIGTSLTAFRPDPAVLDSRYLLGALRSEEFQRQLALNMGQTTRNQVPITAQRKLRIRLPSMMLQRRFATDVECVERQKARMRAHLAELDTLFASLQSRAFSGEL